MGTCIEIRDKNGHALPPDADGEVFLFSTTKMLGYMDPHTSEPDPSTSPTWFATGDVGHLDEEGFLYITGRKKDLIIKGGLNVSRRTVEEVILEHPQARDVAVIGSPHPLLGEEIVAIVQPVPVTEWSTLRAELRSLCRSRLAEAARPSQIIELHELPRSSTGKIQKNKLRESIASLLVGELTL